MTLLERLKEHNKNDILPMHMPGHKRKFMAGLPTDIDITEIKGFEGLPRGDGILFDMQKYAAGVFGAGRAFFITNGSSGGVLSSVVGLTGYGDELIVSRNSHKSVYNAIELNGLRPHYLAPSLDENGIAESVTPAEVLEAIKKAPKSKIVIITSPTYEGVVSDIKGIAEVVHSHGMKLIVDSAHGAHFGFLGMPEHAIKCGADAVVCSLHKTLPAMTSSAVLLTSKEVGEVLAKYVTMFQTTSPSYVLLASTDECVRLLDSDGDKLFSQYVKNLDKFSEGAKDLKYLKVLCKGSDSKQKHSRYFDFDAGKIVILTTGTDITGPVLMERLREHKIELEMCYNQYGLAMTSIFDTEEDLKRLLDALIFIDKSLSYKSPEVAGKETFNRGANLTDSVSRRVYVPEFNCRASDIKPLNASKTPVALSLNKVCTEYIWVYPPGIPLVAAGEKIDRNILDIIKNLNSTGLSIHSTKGEMPEFVYVADVPKN